MKPAVESFPQQSPVVDDARLPPAALPATAHVIAMTELAHPRPAELDAAHKATRVVAALINPLADPANPLRHVKARLSVCVGTVELTVGELLDAKEQQVLRLDQPVDAPVEILLEGRVVARGTLVALDDHFAVRITEIPVRLDLP